MQGAAKYHQWKTAHAQTPCPKDDPDVRMLLQGIKETALVAEAKAVREGSPFRLKQKQWALLQGFLKVAALGVNEEEIWRYLPSSAHN